MINSGAQVNVISQDVVRKHNIFTVKKESSLQFTMMNDSTPWDQVAQHIKSVLLQVRMNFTVKCSEMGKNKSQDKNARWDISCYAEDDVPCYAEDDVLCQMKSHQTAQQEWEVFLSEEREILLTESSDQRISLNMILMMNHEVILEISWLKHHNSDIDFKLRTVWKCILINEMVETFKSLNKDLETQLSE